MLKHIISSLVDKMGDEGRTYSIQIVYMTNFYIKNNKKNEVD
jgi:hypothetical protein